MSVVGTTALPSQPSSGNAVFQGFGGDGYTAPIGEYLVDARVAHDSGGGTASVTVTMDPRYTNAVVWANLIVSGSATAVEYLVSLARNASSNEASMLIGGTFPFVAATLSTSNNAFVWFPPPMFYQGEGEMNFVTPNVDGDSSFLRMQIYLFNINVRQTAALPYLLQNFPASGGSVPV